MKLLMGLLGGVVGGVVGAGAWAAVVYATNYELGILAIGVGAIVGAGVMIGSGREGGPTFGVLAAALAIAAVVVGKWSWLGLVTQGPFDSEVLIAGLADTIIEERLEAGQRVDHLYEFRPNRPLRDDYAREVWTEAERRWSEYSPAERERFRRVPAMMNPDIHLVRLAGEYCDEGGAECLELDWPDDFDVTTAWREAHFPPEVWAEAVRRWNAWSSSHQEQYLAWVEQEEAQRDREMMDAIRSDFFHEFFDLYDALWLLLAVAAAYQIAARSEE